MEDICPFCEIVRGRSPAEVVYEDESVVAFLCEPPATWGHVLIVPRAHRRDIWSIRVNEATAVMAAAHVLAGVLREALGAVGVNLRQNSGSRAGQDVFHFHLHLVPRYHDDTVLPGCVWGTPPWRPPAGGDEERGRVARRIREAVGARSDS
jgi:histidine triad (HIT) family protein